MAALAHAAEDVEVAEKEKVVEKRGIYGGYSGIGYQSAYDPTFGGGAGFGGYTNGLGGYTGGYSGALGGGGYAGLAGGLSGGYANNYYSGYYPKSVTKVAYEIGHGGKERAGGAGNTLPRNTPNQSRGRIFAKSVEILEQHKQTNKSNQYFVFEVGFHS